MSAEALPIRRAGGTCGSDTADAMVAPQFVTLRVEGSASMSDIAPARTIVVRAQHAVDRWKADRTRPDFAGAIEAAVGLH
jgi:hypothetical protein